MDRDGLASVSSSPQIRIVATFSAEEAHSATRVSDELPAGTYEVTVAASVSDGDDDPALTFRLDERVLTAEVKLVS